MTNGSVPRIIVRQLALTARIGVHEWEKVEPQPVVVDLELDAATEAACVSDRLDDTVDYAAIIDRIRRVAMLPHALVEAMAHSMCAAILEDTQVTGVRLTLMKLAPFPGAQVGVVLQRRQPARPCIQTTRELNGHQYF